MCVCVPEQNTHSVGAHECTHGHARMRARKHTNVKLPGTIRQDKVEWMEDMTDMKDYSGLMDTDREQGRNKLREGEKEKLNRERD